MAIRMFASSTLVLFVMTVAFAQAKDEEKKSVEDQKFCPIMTKKEVNEESEIVEYNGVKIRMCCDVCIEKFNEYPEAYLLKEFLPQLNDMEIPERKIKQTFCPVYPDRVVSEKDLSVEYQGKTVYLFNKAALKKWEKDPEKYADPEILPQLKEDAETADAAAKSDNVK